MYEIYDARGKILDILVVKKEERNNSRSMPITSG